jgi:hypothetical protein
MRTYVFKWANCFCHCSLYWVVSPVLYLNSKTGCLIYLAIQWHCIILRNPLVLYMVKLPKRNQLISSVKRLYISNFILYCPKFNFNTLKWNYFKSKPNPYLKMSRSYKVFYLSADYPSWIIIGYWKCQTWQE